MEKQKIFITFSLDVHKKIDIVDKIEKEIKVKNCKICKQDKKLSEYYKANRGKTYNSYCKECSKQISKQHRIDNSEHYKQYYQDNKEQIYQHVNKNTHSIPPGIYGIYEQNDLLYIGESATPYRRMKYHFSNLKDLNQAYKLSPICYALSIDELQRENLSFKMLEYVDDDSARKQRETALIQRYQPRYNNYHVNA